VSALTGISVWITLVIVIPGLVTVSTIFGAFKVSAPVILDRYAESPAQLSAWFWTAIVVTIMILTQTFGILLEEILVRNRLLGRYFIINKGKETEERHSVYEQYEHLYFLLADLRPDEDNQGHLQRAIALFFLTNNTLISFSVGIVVSIILYKFFAISKEPSDWYHTIIYISFLFILLILSYMVGVIRFKEMAKSIYSTKRARKQVSYSNGT
jgi:hypothetical protein